MSGSELVSAEPQRFLPVLSVTEAVQRRQAIVEFVREVMKPDIDFGVIPGTTKPTLLKPGAEKLCTLFGLTTRFQILTAIEDWTGANYDAEPFFYYLYRCQLWRDSHLIAEGDGSCNSREKKYRYRDAQCCCPDCGKAAIIRGKAEYGGGWLCWSKRGGCGTKFSDGDEQIESQPVGRIANADIADQVNTIQKMAQKRALIASTLLAVNASEFFTQDEEGRVIEGEFAPLVPDAVLPETTEAEQAGRRETTLNRHAMPVASRNQPSSEPVAPILTLQETTAPAMTAVEARQAFEAKARRLVGIQDRAMMARLAIVLLGGKPERWTATIWQTAANKPESEWRTAFASLPITQEASSETTMSQPLAA